MLLSIIIINYNTFGLTCNCIQSILDTTTVEHEIILIDNNSKDKEPGEFLKRFPGIRLFPLQENVGFGRANNFGMSKASGKYILLLNSDTIVHPNTINETVTYLEEHSAVDILGCRVKLEDGTDQHTVYPYNGELSFLRTAVVLAKRNAIIKEILKPIHRLLYKNQNEPSGPTEDSVPVEESKEEIIPNYYKGNRIGELVGVFLLFKKEVFLESKGFDPDFFMYYEELEWFLKRLHKYNVVYYPHASITHFHGQSDVYGTMKFNGFLSYNLFWYKMSYFHYLLFLAYNIIEVPSRVVIGTLQWEKKHFTHAGIILKSLPYVLMDIPRYKNSYGARKKMLKSRALNRSQL